jgi:hypothetical protein
MIKNKHLRIRINETQLRKIIDNVIQNPCEYPSLSSFVRSAIIDKLVVGHQERGLTLPGEKNI